jgi:esterase/lipase superfamily enzyme
MVVLALGLLALPALAADSAKAPNPASATATPEKHSDNGSSVFCNGIRLGDEIELVNTRSICGGGNSDLMRNGLKVENYANCDDVGHRHWQSSDLDSFLAFDPSVPTIIFVHGNQITPGDAKDEGLMMYRTIIRHGSDAPRIRLVIFSWPSSKVGGLLYDVREKAARTEPAGWHLAWLLDQMQPETQISLVGFSFGARIITGGLHVLAGGSLNSLALAEHTHPHREPMNVVLMAAADHSYWLAEGQRHGLAMTQVNRMLLINNCEDRAMRYYDMITPGRGGPQALGLCGPTQINHDYAEKIMNRDVSRYVGTEHLFATYLCAPGDAGLIWSYSEPATATDTKTGG